MGFDIWTFLSGIFILAASCYALFKFSDELEDVGNELGRLLRLPQDVVASTFAALATSGPEIVMAILAATPFILNEAWSALMLGEKASSGTLNMAFSAMDNLLGIGAVAILFLIRSKKVDPKKYIPVKPSVLIGLGFYVVSSVLLSVFITDRLLTEVESWVLMIIGIVFIYLSIFYPQMD
jgi:Ca2+/Na+ antiporter